ncbi:MAG: hypothetical protein PHX78_06775 [bacterium]|nr:hypothetical protein [bacterium]
METLKSNLLEKPDSWINQFPFPLAYSFRIMQNTNEEAVKFNRIIDLYECILKYNTIIMISDYIRNRQKETSIDFMLNKYRPSIGHWYHIFQEIMLYFKKENIMPFIPQFTLFYFGPNGTGSKNKEIIESIIEIRNKNKGHGITLSPRAYKNLIDELYPLIISLMENLVFLKDYQLITINSIGFKSGKFIFNASNCMGPHPEFKKELINAEIPLPDHQLILYSTYSSTSKTQPPSQTSKNNNFLSLHPYLILIECHECSKEEMFFYEANLDNRKIEYLSYQYGHRLQTAEYNSDFAKIFINFANFVVDKKLDVTEEKTQKKELPSPSGSLIRKGLIRWLLILFFIVFSISALFKYYSSEKSKNNVIKVTTTTHDLTYLKIYDFSKAYKQIKDKTGNDPQNIMTYYNTGILYEENGWIQAALEQYKKVIEIDPNFILASKKIEELSTDIDNFNVMIKGYENYFKSSHKNLNLIAEIANKFYQLGAFSIAISEYENLLSITTDNLNAWLNLSQAYTLQGNYSKAIEVLKNAQGFFPNSEIICFNLGLNYELSGQSETAIENFIQSITINPNFAPPYYSLADAYSERHEQTKAIDNLNKFISVFSDRKWTEKAKLKLEILQKNN